MAKNTPIGVYLTEKEKAEIRKIAARENITSHAYIQYAVRWFLKEYKIDSGILKKESKIVLQLPGKRD